ncbi:DNA polymerase III subunit delta [Thermosipho sp. 1063]|uniref:DNA polymerase III subunit delta n=1 Tax=unclassified Thermosipho (in: thermotogales) TaxID=2676525 RepID=UPI00094933F9|nr:MULTISPECIES: DNA polymerase III subunit delta [unclassified Thermosipho (in: thermotogales)]ANQ54076.1 DNA polymerase III subunit delta [Thermosipho sp. 1070]APT72521.1 DNA polymerase III subunit delta [Thermosipho sp. 1063]
MPIINLFGNSDLMKEKYVESLKDRVKSEYIRIYPGYDIPVVIEKLSNLGLFSENVIVDIIDFDKFKTSERKKILELNVSDKDFLILRTQNKIKGLKVEEFKLPNVWEEEKWKKLISKFLVDEGLKNDEELINLLFENVGPNEYAIYNEIKKLKVFGKDLSIELAKDLIHKYTTSKLDDFCFMISEKRKEVFKCVKEITKDYEFPKIVYSLANHFISLYKLAIYANGKVRFSWPEISKISRELKVSSSKIARFVGFKFKNQRFEPVNHLITYDLDKIEAIIKRLYFLDRAVKTGGVVDVELLNFIKEVW